MLNLIRAEWLKLTKRPLTWVLLAIFLGLLALQSAVQLLVVQASDAGLLGQGATGIAQVAEYRRRIGFPGLFGAIYSHINGLGGIFAIILTAAAMGSEYSWGTLRTQLARQPNRVVYLLAKLVTLILLVLAAMLLALLVGSLLGWALALLGGGTPPPDGASLTALPLALLRALLVVLPYMLLTLCFTIYGRSLLAGIAGGLVYLAIEAGVGALTIFAELGGIWHTLYDFMIGQNINTLIVLNSHAFGLQPELLSPALRLEVLPSPLQATLILVFYCAFLLATALHFFVRRDITGAS